MSGPRLLNMTPEDIGKPPAERADRVTLLPAGGAGAEKPRRQTKKERLREEAMAILEEAREFAESKPTRKGLREYFERRIKELNDPYAD